MGLFRNSHVNSGMLPLVFAELTRQYIDEDADHCTEIFSTLEDRREDSWQQMGRSPMVACGFWRVGRLCSRIAYVGEKLIG